MNRCCMDLSRQEDLTRGATGDKRRQTIRASILTVSLPTLLTNIPGNYIYGLSTVGISVFCLRYLKLLTCGASEISS